MKKIILSTALFTILSSTSILAQDDNPPGWFAVETDPFTSVLGAKTISFIVEPRTMEHWSFFANISQVDLPNEIDDIISYPNRGKGFDAKVPLAVGASLDYFFKPEREGTYVGILQLLFSNEVSRNEQKTTFLTHNIMPRIGYRWFTGRRKRFYLNPFFALRTELLLSGNNTVDGETYEPVPIGPFMTVHVGWRFN